MSDLDPDANFLDQALPENFCNYSTVAELNNNIPNSKQFSLLNYNISSFHQNGDQFESLLESVNIKFQCIVISETWNTEMNIDRCNLPNYNDFHTLRSGDNVCTRSGGISVFCSDEIHASKINNLSICTANIETCVVKMKYLEINYVVLALYRPNQGSKIDFIQELDQIINSEDLNNCKVFVVGDFNLNLNDLEDSHVVEFASKLYSKSFISLIDKPTRFPRGNQQSYPSCLDMIWTNNLGVNSAGIIRYDQSDHLPTFCTVDSNSIIPENEKIKIETRPFSESNLSKFVAKLNDINWDNELDYNSIENSISGFSNKIDEIYKTCFPLKIKYISRKRHRNKWISQDVKKLINKKSEAFKKYRLGLISKEENNRIKNEMSSKINKAKHEFYKNSFELFKGNIKKSWSILHELMKKKQSKREEIQLKVDTKIIVEPYEVANTFANYFSSVGSTLESNLRNSDQCPYSRVDRNANTFAIFPVTQQEITNIILKLKTTRTDPNKISVQVFKSVGNLVSAPLTKIINNSFLAGIFPECLKMANITPVFKKENKQLVTNYRPISSLPFISKIFERCMANRILSFFNKFKLFSDKQFGFLKNKSTKDAICHFTESIYDALDAKNHNISIMVDLKAAFDTVNHSILLKKLERYGVRGYALDWFKSYLTDRKFRVRIGNKFSEEKTVNIGIPQGSILGPILFIIYNNDLPSISPNLMTTLFADDTNFSLTHKNFEPMVGSLNDELLKIHDWTVANRLTINNSKTELLLFSNRSTPHNNEQVVLNGSYVKFVDHAKFLGIYIDSKMNFKKHINYITGKIAKHAGILYRIKQGMPLKTRLTYYNSFVLPYLNYNILHWGNTNDNHLKPLIIIQKRIIRIIADADYLAHTTPLFKKLNLLKLVDLYNFQAVLDTHQKIQKGLYQIEHNVNTRNCNLAKPKGHSLTRTQQAITFSGPILWNSLPPDIRCIKSISNFKKNLKSHYLSNYTTTDD